VRTDLVSDFLGTVVGHDHASTGVHAAHLRCRLIDAPRRHADGAMLRIDHLFQLPSVLAGLEGAADSG
jgi:hypothetical protein